MNKKLLSAMLVCAAISSQMMLSMEGSEGSPAAAGSCAVMSRLAFVRPSTYLGGSDTLLGKGADLAAAAALVAGVAYTNPRGLRTAVVSATKALPGLAASALTSVRAHPEAAITGAGATLAAVGVYDKLVRAPAIAVAVKDAYAQGFAAGKAANQPATRVVLAGEDRSES